MNTLITQMLTGMLAWLSDFDDFESVDAQIKGFISRNVFFPLAEFCYDNKLSDFKPITRWTDNDFDL